MYHTLAAMLICAVTLSAENIVFPRGNTDIVDVTQPPYNADNTGANDATAALNGALGDNNTWRTIYLPDGTYKVSGTLSFPNCITVGCDGSTGAVGPILQGQSRAGTVIRLVDGTFTNASDPQYVLYTGEGVAQNFNRNVHNLTINIGSNNPGATGVYFYSNNLGLMSEVDIISEDGQGAVGLALGYGEQGPCMVSQIYIRGFSTGIVSNALNLVVCSRITLEGQSVLGVDNEHRYLAIDSLTSINSVPAVRNRGDLTLVNAHLTGGGSGVTAIDNNGQLFARGVVTEGYQRALSSNGSNVPTGTTVDEFSTTAAQSLFQSSSTSMNLPIKHPPDPGWDDTTKWGNVAQYKGGLGMPQLSDAEALQAAIDDTSKTIVVLPFARTFDITDTVFVRGRTKRIVGCSGSLMGSGALVVVDAPDAPPVVKIQRISSGIPVVQRSSRTVVVESMRGQMYARGPGEFYIVDVTTHGSHISQLVCDHPQAKVWTWQFDDEHGPLVDNDYGIDMSAGQVVVFGWKSEGKGTKVHATGGVLEMMGIMQYSNSHNSDMAGLPMFVVSNTQWSLAGMSQVTFSNELFTLLVQETRGGETRELTSSQNPAGTNLPLYTGFDFSSIEPRIRPVRPATGAGLSVRGTRVRLVGATGTTHTKVMLVNAKGAVVASSAARAHEVELETAGLGRGVYRLIGETGTCRITKSYVPVR